MFRRGKLAFLSTKDDRIKIMNDRINLTEKHLIELCTNFASCTRKVAKCRDSYDELARSAKNYADEEEINESLSDGLKSFTNAVTIVGDYMDVQVHRMEIKIVNELAMFENLCKTTRDQLRVAVIARDKEVLKQRQMLEIKSKFAANNTAADSELVKAKLEVNRTNKEIEDIICNFEKRKLGDVKTILSDFILISMKYHTKVLEVLSASYYDISNIDEKSDLSEFQKLMKSKEDPQTRKQALKKGLRSQSMESLDRNKLLSPLRRRQKLSGSSKNLTTKTDDEQDDDDDDDEDDEEVGSDDNSKSEQDDSASGSDYVDNPDEVSENGSDAKSKTKDLKKITSKFQAKQTLKTTATAAPHVFKTKSIVSQSKPFVVKSGGVGIPSATYAKQNIVKYDDDGKLVDDTSVNEPGRRLVTVVESKKPIRKKTINDFSKKSAARENI